MATEELSADTADYVKQKIDKALEVLRVRFRLLIKDGMAVVHGSRLLFVVYESGNHEQQIHLACRFIENVQQGPSTLSTDITSSARILCKRGEDIDEFKVVDAARCAARDVHFTLQGSHNLRNDPRYNLVWIAQTGTSLFPSMLYGIDDLQHMSHMANEAVNKMVTGSEDLDIPELIRAAALNEFATSLGLEHWTYAAIEQRRETRSLMLILNSSSMKFHTAGLHPPRLARLLQSVAFCWMVYCDRIKSLHGAAAPGPYELQTASFVSHAVTVFDSLLYPYQEPTRGQEETPQPEAVSS